MQSGRAAHIVACAHTHPIAHGGVMVLSALGLDRVCLQEFSLNSPVPGLTVIIAPSAPSVPMFQAPLCRQTAQTDSSV